jgi:hypothetical protein
MAHRYQKMLVNRITRLSQPLPEIAAALPHEGREANKFLKHLEDHPIAEYGLRREIYLGPILRSCNWCCNKYLKVVVSHPYRPQSSAVVF